MSILTLTLLISSLKNVKYILASLAQLTNASVIY